MLILLSCYFGVVILCVKKVRQKDNTRNRNTRTAITVYKITESPLHAPSLVDRCV